MTIKTSALPPPIQQCFNRWLLDPFAAIFYDFENRIIPLANKKIRDIDLGKKKEFERLAKLYREEYERQKVKKEEYDKKIENAPKRSALSLTAKTCRFTRMGSQESNVRIDIRN